MFVLHGIFFRVEVPFKTEAVEFAVCILCTERTTCTSLL